jgi:hypothetical protein
MSNGSERIKDLLSAPMEAVIIALGVGIAKAQRELDLHAIDLQKEINEDPLLSEYGLQPTFYQIPKAELELNIAIAMEEQPPKNKALTAVSAVKALAPYQLKQLYLQPVNASYSNQFNYNVQASSKLKVTFMPVPPPATESAVTPRLTRDDVMKLATPFLISTGDTPARLAVNFNGQGRMWFVLQYRVEAEGTLTRLALVVIDDDTGTVVKHA